MTRQASARLRLRRGPAAARRGRPRPHMPPPLFTAAGSGYSPARGAVTLLDRRPPRRRGDVDTRAGRRWEDTAEMGPPALGCAGCDGGYPLPTHARTAPDKATLRPPPYRARARPFCQNAPGYPPTHEHTTSRSVEPHAKGKLARTHHGLTGRTCENVIDPCRRGACKRQGGGVRSRSIDAPTKEACMWRCGTEPYPQIASPTVSASGCRSPYAACAAKGGRIRPPRLAARRWPLGRRARSAGAGWPEVCRNGVRLHRRLPRPSPAKRARHLADARSQHGTQTMR